jgi:hypothetical protein
VVEKGCILQKEGVEDPHCRKKHCQDRLPGVTGRVFSGKIVPPLEMFPVFPSLPHRIFPPFPCPRAGAGAAHTCCSLFPHFILEGRVIVSPATMNVPLPR